MPGFPHEAEVALFRNRPALARELLSAVFGLEAPPGAVPAVEDSELTEPIPAVRRADVAVVERLDGQAVGVTLVEVQRSRDEDKFWVWPAYAVTERARLRCEVRLVVVALDAGVARWARRTISLGPLGSCFTPLVIGPEQVPRYTNAAAAFANPELAVLSAVVHGDVADVDEAAQTTLAVVHGLDDYRCAIYVDFLLCQSNPLTRRILEVLMFSNHEFKSEFGRQFYASGKAEGKTEGKAQAVLTVLRGRGLVVDSMLEAAILNTTDMALLERWLLRALRVERAEQILEDDRI